MPTKNGIEYNLYQSSYKCFVYGLDFFFSSATHLEKFASNLDKRVEWLNDSMGRRFHYTLDMTLVAILQLYCQVETRGFLIHNLADGEWYNCQENIILSGMKISGKN